MHVAVNAGQVSCIIGQQLRSDRQLAETISSDMNLHMKPIFARNGIPETVVADNGPQYARHTSLRGLPLKNDS